MIRSLLKSSCPSLLLALAASSATAIAQIPTPPLTVVEDLPLPGAAVRFDYQSFSPETGRLYIAHMNADQLVIFDTKTKKTVANLDGFKRIHGVIAVPELGRVYASVTGEHQVAAVDAKTLQKISSSGPVNYPDGLAYSPATKRIFVSDEHGGVDAVIDTRTNELVASIPLGGGAGNTVYDRVSGNILVAVHGKNDLAVIDPASLKIIARHSLPGVSNPHGIALDPETHRAFIAGEENHSLALLDLSSGKLLHVYETGDDPDVLAFDPSLKRLYVSAESGQVAVFQEDANGLRSLGRIEMPHAHTVSVDPATHLVYFPLENIAGKPILRVMKPSI